MMTKNEETRILSMYACTGRQGEIAHQLMSTYAMSEQDSYGYLTISADTLNAMLRDAAWRGFCDGIDACKT